MPVAIPTAEHSSFPWRFWAARATDPGAGEGQKQERVFSLAADPFPSPKFLLTPDQDGEGDDVHDQLSQAYEKRCQFHQRRPPSVTNGSGSRKTSNH